MKYKILLALLVLLVTTLPTSALQIVFQEGKDTLIKGEEAEFEFAIVNAYENDKVLIETKVDRVIVESDLEVNPRIFYEGGALLPKEGLIVQFRVRADEIGNHILKLKVYYTRTMYSATEFGATIVVKDVAVRNVLLKVVDLPSIVLQNETLVLNEVNRVEFRLIGEGNTKLLLEPLFDCKPSVFHFDSLKNAKGVFEFIPKKEEELKFKLSYGNVEKILIVKPKYVKSNGISAVLNAKDFVTLNDCVNVTLEILNLRKDPIYNVMVRFVGEGIVKPEQKVIEVINPNELKKVRFVFSPQNKSHLKFYILYFDGFGT